LIDKSTGKAPTGNYPTVTISKNGNVLQTITAQGGYIYFSKLCEGDYTLSLSSGNYQTQTWHYTSVCNKFETTTRFLELLHNSDSCCHGKITVSVLDSLSRSGLDSVVVSLSKNGSTPTYQHTTHGTVTFTGLCPGEYSLYYSGKNGWTRIGSATWSVTLGCNDSAGFVRTLYRDTCCNGKITVRVKHPHSGENVDSVNVNISQNGTQLKSGMTHNGLITFTGLCSGTYSLYYWKSNWYRTETPGWDVTIHCNDSLYFEKTMIPLSECCNGTISGTVVDSVSGNPLANVTVLLYSNNTQQGTATSDSTGSFHFTGICPATYILCFRATDYNSFYLTNVVTGCNDSKTYTVKLKRK